MHIDETHFPIDFDWTGALEPPSQMYATRGSGLPRVSLGKPVWWSDQKMLGENWSPPAGGARYGLARFAFSLRPEERQVIRSAEFIVYLHAKGAGPRPIVFDLLPKTTTEEQTGSRTFGLDPKFKFANLVEVSGVSAGTTLDVKQAVPVTAADGVGESAARWVFSAQRAHPLLGSQIVFATVELPPGVEAARASVQLTAEVETNFGLVRGLLPEEERQSKSWVLE